MHRHSGSGQVVSVGVLKRVQALGKGVEGRAMGGPAAWAATNFPPAKAIQSEPGIPCFALHGLRVENDGSNPKNMKSSALVASARASASASDIPQFVAASLVICLWNQGAHRPKGSVAVSGRFRTYA
jgi:hypothetical protein